MKTTIILLLTFAPSLILAQANNKSEVSIDYDMEKTITSDEDITDILTGLWYGVDTTYRNNNQSWTQKRKSNGKYKIKFTSFKYGMTIRNKEKGKWWYKDGIFYEINSKRSTVPDKYNIKIVSENEIIFDKISLDKSSDIKEGEYSFIDKRIETKKEAKRQDLELYNQIIKGYIIEFSQPATVDM